MSAVQADQRRLLVAAREGDAAAIDRLYQDNHPLALRIARTLCRPGDVEDVVSEAFTKVLERIEQGGGPQVSFRAYLITAVRHAAADTQRRDARLVWRGDLDDLEPSVATPTPVDSRAESALLADAVSALPTRWQLVLWWTTVERRSLTEVGAALGISANATAALAFRARVGLRTAYLSRHIEASENSLCQSVRDTFTRSGRPQGIDEVSQRSRIHLGTCESCSQAHAQFVGLLEGALVPS